MQNLAIGSTGQSVMDLQKMLNANGFNLTVDGKFGPLTQNALKNYQGSHGLVPDGIYGPKTAAVLSPQPVKPAPAPTPTPTQPTVSPQKAMLAAVSDVAQTAATTGKPPVSFSEALNLASKDPTIMAKYADMAKLDRQSFQQQLLQAQTQYGTQAELYKTKFENDRKALAEQQAAAGTAYSGFRGKAQKDLAQTESGIVTSSRSQQQQQLNQLTSSFEKSYGTGATPIASITAVNPLGSGIETLTGQQAGGITGTVAPAQKEDVLGSAYRSYQTTQFPI